MPQRVFSFLLSFVLLCCGLVSVEPLRAPAPPAQVLAVAQAETVSPLAAPQGPLAHHPLDDLPSQVQSEPPVESPGLLPSPPPPGGRLPGRVRPHGTLGDAVASPDLAGLLRPPCGTVLPG